MVLYRVCCAGWTQGDRLMREPGYVPDQDQLLKDLRGVGVGTELGGVAPDAVSISVDEYLSPQDARHDHKPAQSHSNDSLLSSVSTSLSLSLSLSDL